MFSYTLYSVAPSEAGTPMRCLMFKAIFGLKNKEHCLNRSTLWKMFTFDTWICVLHLISFI